ncbi:unnamed protein product, partial [Arabidopsis halleri]
HYTDSHLVNSDTSHMYSFCYNPSRNWKPYGCRRCNRCFMKLEERANPTNHSRVRL